MRVLVASDSFAPKIDGVSDTAGHIATGLARRGHNVTVLAPAPGEAHHDGARVQRVGSVPFPFYPELRLAWNPAQAWRSVREAKPDAAVVLTPGPLGLATVAALPRVTRMVNVYTTDIPAYVRAYHLGPAAPFADAGLRWMAQRAVVTLAPTRHVTESLRARRFRRARTWGRGVDAALFRPDRRSAAMRAMLSGGRVEAPLVLYVGRLAREKRLDDLVAAARSLPGVRLAFVGDGPERAHLEAACSGLDAVFTGYLRGEELAAAFASADVFAFPSDTDTFGQVVLQAMASGVPVIVPAGSAPAEFTPNGLAGLHVPARNPGALAAAIHELVADPGRLAMLGRSAREAALDRSWDALLDRLERHLVGSR